MVCRRDHDLHILNLTVAENGVEITRHWPKMLALSPSLFCPLLKICGDLLRVHWPSCFPAPFGCFSLRNMLSITRKQGKNNGIKSFSLSLWAFFFVLFNCLVVYSVFSKSHSDKICEAVISTGGTFALLIFWRYRCSTTISDKFSKSLKSSRNQNSNVGLLLTIIIAEFKFYSNKILKQIFASKKFHRKFRQPEPSLWAIHFFFIRY